MPEDYEGRLRVIQSAAQRERSAAQISEDSILRSHLEKIQLENERLKIDNRSLEEDVAKKSDDRHLRKSYADRIFKFLSIYSLFCSIMIVLQGDPTQTFKLPESVLNTLIGSTAIAVIGLVGAIVAGLFRPPT